MRLRVIVELSERRNGHDGAPAANNDAEVGRSVEDDDGLDAAELTVVTDGTNDTEGVDDELTVIAAAGAAVTFSSILLVVDDGFPLPFFPDI
jgi:hypothetical protein